MTAPTARRVAIALAVALVAFSGPADAAFKGRIADLLEQATGGVLVSIERIKHLQRTGDPDMPDAIKVPAQRFSQVVCRVVANKLQCYQSAMDVCPGSIIVEQAETTYSCETDCHGNTPDPSGQCECDIRYDTCTPFP